MLVMNDGSGGSVGAVAVTAGGGEGAAGGGGGTAAGWPIGPQRSATAFEAGL